MLDHKAKWWKNGTCYQVWPASYKDSNSDGMGDLQGIISTLDYLKDLGIDFIWLSPMYDSPQHDMGYDISNYEDVWSKYGTLADMNDLIREVHARKMRIILDLVVNHTSDEHDWFRESRKSRENDYSDWYIWRDPKYVDDIRCPPTNWKAAFGGSAWTYVPGRDQYYLHLFTEHQPDLNWENAITRKAIYDSAIKFWLDKGVDGFRVDTVNLYSKDITFPDAPVTDHKSEFQNAEIHYANGPRMHEWLREQRDVLDAYGDIFLVGELPGTKISEVHKYVSASSRELDCVFDFGICELGGRYGRQPHETWQHTLPEFKAAFQKTQSLLDYSDAWTTVFAENHDQPRSLSMFGSTDPKYQTQAGRMLAMLLASLSGTLFIYQGQEFGTINIATDAGEEYFQDVCALNYLREVDQKYPHDKQMQKLARDSVRRIGRDNARTPVQWNAGPYAGFTTAECTPWMPVNDNYCDVNAEQSRKDPKGIFAMWKQMLQIRREYADVLIHGTFEIHDVDNMSTFTFVKKSATMEVLVTLNFGDVAQGVDLPPSWREGSGMKLLVSNIDKPGKQLGPWEGRLYVQQL